MKQEGFKYVSGIRVEDVEGVIKETRADYFLQHVRSPTGSVKLGSTIIHVDQEYKSPVVARLEKIVGPENNGNSSMFRAFYDLENEVVITYGNEEVTLGKREVVEVTTVLYDLVNKGNNIFETKPVNGNGGGLEKEVQKTEQVEGSTTEKKVKDIRAGPLVDRPQKQ